MKQSILKPIFIIEIVLFFGIISQAPYKENYLNIFTRFKLYTAHTAADILQHPIATKYIHTEILKEKLQNPPAWAKKQIDAEFANYNDFSVENINQTFKQLSSKTDLIVKFTIKNRQVTALPSKSKIHPEHQYAIKQYTRIFKYLSKNQYLHDVSFIIKLSDYFNDDLEFSPQYSPILAIDKDLTRQFDKNLILIPSHLNFDDIGTIYSKVLNANQKYPWEKKENKILWRGCKADISGFRHKVVEHSEAFPNSILDAKFCDRLSKKRMNYMELEDQIKAKYLLSIDGSTASWQRPVWQLFSNSVMIKQKSSIIMWFYAPLRQDIHYIEVNTDLNNLLNIVNKYSDTKLRHISQNGQNFAKENLMVDDLFAYLIMVLQKHQSLQGNLHK